MRTLHQIYFSKLPDWSTFCNFLHLPVSLINVIDAHPKTTLYTLQKSSNASRVNLREYSEKVKLRHHSAPLSASQPVLLNHFQTTQIGLNFALEIRGYELRFHNCVGNDAVIDVQGLLYILRWHRRFQLRRIRRRAQDCHHGSALPTDVSGV